jgi:hypothetical protein
MLLAIVFGVLAGCGAVVEPEARELFVPGLRGGNLNLSVTDTTGDLVEVRAVPGAELGAEGNDLNGQTPVLAKRAAGPNEVRILWISSACEMAARMTISRPNKITISPGLMEEDCGDIFNYRAVVLVFRGPVQPAALELELEATAR